MSPKPVVSALALVITALLAFAAPSHAFRLLKEGQPAPGFTLKDRGGADVSLSSFSGKVVVVLFFRTDQENSVKALGELQAVQDKYGPKGAQMLAITPDRNDGAKVDVMLKQTKLSFPILIDEDRKVYGDWGVFLFPTTGILGKDGGLVKHVSSYNRKYGETVEGYVRFALGELDEAKLDAVLNPKEREESSPEQKKAERHMMLAGRMVERKLLDKAAAEYQEAVTAYPALVAARVDYGFVLLKLDKPAEARAQFEEALKLDKRAPDAEAGLGASLVALGELDKGIETLEGALKLNPKPARALFELGKAYEKKGLHEKAAGNYRKAIEELGGALW